MKKKAKIILVVAILFFIFGFALPYLISSTSTELVLAGFGLVGVMVVVAWQKIETFIRGKNNENI